MKTRSPDEVLLVVFNGEMQNEMLTPEKRGPQKASGSAPQCLQFAGKYRQTCKRRGLGIPKKCRLHKQKIGPARNDKNACTGKRSRPGLPPRINVVISGSLSGIEN